MEKGINKGPINIGSDEEISIKNLTQKLCQYTGKNPQLVFDKTKPDGHARRASNITKAKQILGWQQKILLDEGLKRTIAWYEEELFHE